MESEANQGDPGTKEPGSKAPSPKALWHGRFDEGPAETLMAFTVCLSYDQRLAAHDVQASIAHVRGLGRANILTSQETEQIVAALQQTGEELAAKKFAFVETDEDIHTAIERRVTELCGDTGAKLHTGRSRNDQVATAFRLWTKDAITQMIESTLTLVEVFYDQAITAGDAYLPGYTHLQQAQPVALAHHFAAHGWALSRDVDRLFDCLARLDVSPLGAGALAGTSLGLQPGETANELGFTGVFQNSLDVTSDRDFVAETLFCVAMLGIHLSRIGEEFVIWSSQEFGFVTLDDQYATGSSMLPQKKNPDIAELARGKAGRFIGNLTGLLATLKGLPLAYNRDLQEDKEPLFDSVDQVLLGLRAVAGMVQTARYNTDVMAAAADNPLAVATDIAELLVSEGVPFRQAHAIVGELVRQSLAEGVPFADVAAAHEKLGPEVKELFVSGASAAQRTSPGGGAPEAVKMQLAQLHDQILADQKKIQVYTVTS